tara:strand:+ start:1797 stop:2195 length:399 start_codon:yes stop_codon:yes gene_type:complete
MKTILATLCIILTGICTSAHGYNLQSYQNITVNPYMSKGYKVVTSVHIMWEQDKVSKEESIAAREAIAKSLKSISLSKLISDKSIDITKTRILSYISENELIGDAKLVEIYITDMVVEYTGENQSKTKNKKR